ncbi:J domain-containing protein [Rhodospirillaceae bacterium SYSU D60014]|uniref:J domain-containing protein n=1 Tax=Virgifigura deserti TaxID=2268457 RepID=UPI000E67653E
MRKPGSRAQTFLPDEGAPPSQGCDHPRCTEAGLYRAPKARQRLNEYYWFCLDHIRDYNRMWNYYEGMSSEEIEAHIREDTVWQRPTWRLGGWNSGGRGPTIDDLQDGFGLFNEDRRRQREDQTRRREIRTPEEQALAVLNLTPPVTMEAVKIRYKDLVKLLHPDANGGDKSAEEQLKLINQAYSTLKSSTTLKDGAYP